MRIGALHRPWALLLSIALMGIGSGRAVAQVDPYLMTDTTVTDCIGELTDSGGPDEAYGNNENLIFTVVSDSPLDVAFLGSVDIEPAAPGGPLFDYLVLHDGPDLASPVLDTLYGSIASPPTYVTSGSLTVHFVSDASAQPQGFHLAWSANPPPPDPPTTALSAPGSCPFPVLLWDLSFPIECDLIDWTTLAVTGQDGTAWAIDTAAAAAISCPGGLSNGLTLPLEDGGLIDGNCTLTADLMVGVRDACDSVWVLPISAQWSATGCGAEPDILLDTDTVCTGGCALLEALPRGCGPTDIAWTGSDGTSFSGAGPWEVCPSATTTYTATATETTTAETTTTTLFTRLGFVQLQWTTAEFGVAIHQLLNGLTTFVISHLDKSEAAGTSRLTVHNKVHALHFAEFRKKTRHLILGDTEGEVPHINTDHDSIRFCSRSPMQDKKEKQKVPFGFRRVFRRGPVGRSEYCASNRPATSRGKQFFTQTSMCRGCCRTKQYAIGVHNTSLASGTTPQSSGRALVRAP